MNFEELLVVETGVGMAAPLVTRALADLGAGAVKLESRARPDFNRGRVRPPGMSDAEFEDIWPQVQDLTAGKASATLNLKSPEGLELLLRFLDRADVWIENYAPGWLERLGLSLEEIHERNPRLVILAQTPYGSYGPRAQQRAYAPIMTALAGVESTVGYGDGEVLGQMSSAIGDLVAAFAGINLVFAALYARERTGRGALLDMSQTEASVSLAAIALAEYGLTEEIPQPRGNAHVAAVPHGIFPAAGSDRWVALAIWSDEEWRQLCGLLGLGESERDRFDSLSGRLADPEAVERAIADRTGLWERDELVRRCQEAGLGCTPVLDCYEAEEAPELVERGLWATIDRGASPPARVTQLPWKFERLQHGPRRSAEQIGTSTRAVLRQFLGLDEAEIDALERAGALT